MRPRLRPGVACIPSEEGVHLISPAGSVNVTGRSAAALMDQLAPRLDGTRELDDLLEALDPKARPIVRQLLATLAEHRVLRDAAQDPPHQLTDAELAHHEEVHRLIESRADAPAIRLQRVLATTVILWTDARTVAHQTRALLRLGFRRFELACGDTESPGPQRARRLIDEESSAEPVPRVAVRWHDDLPISPAPEGEPIAAIAHRLDEDPDVTARLEAGAVAAGASFCAVVWDGGTGWVSPPASTGADPGWRSMRWRLREASGLPWAGGRPGGPSRPAPATGEGYVTDPVIAIAANRAALSLFEEVAGLSERTHGWRLDATTLETDTVRVAPHRWADRADPLEPPPAEPTTTAETLAEARRRAAPPAEEFARAAVHLVDEVAGPLRSLGEGDLLQAPLSASAIDIADIGGYGAPGRSLEVVEFGVDLAEARHRATHRALQIAALLAAGPRAADDQRWAHDPLTDEPVRITQPFPWLLEGAEPDRRRVPGLASGETYELALRAGLLGLLADAASRGDLPDLAPAAPVDVTARDHGRTARLARMLAAARPNARVVTLGSPCGIALYAVHDDGWLSLAADTDPWDAVDTAMLEAIAADQGVADPTRPATRLKAAPPAPHAEHVAIDVPAPPTADGGAEVNRRAAQLLSEAGQRPLAVPLDDDPAISRLAPHVLAVIPRS